MPCQCLSQKSLKPDHVPLFPVIFEYHFILKAQLRPRRERSTQRKCRHDHTVVLFEHKQGKQIADLGFFHLLQPHAALPRFLPCTYRKKELSHIDSGVALTLHMHWKQFPQSRRNNQVPRIGLPRIPMPSRHRSPETIFVADAVVFESLNYHLRNPAFKPLPILHSSSPTKKILFSGKLTGSDGFISLLASFSPASSDIS